jgi:hypothetical protein
MKGQVNETKLLVSQKGCWRNIPITLTTRSMSANAWFRQRSATI